MLIYIISNYIFIPSESVMQIYKYCFMHSSFSLSFSGRYKWSKCREYVSTECSFIKGMSVSHPDPKFKDHHRREGDKIVRARGWRGLGQNSIF